MSKSTLASYAFLAMLAAATCPAEPPAVICATCHAPQAQQLARSVHTRLHCQECHGGAEAYSVAPEELAKLTGPGASDAAFAHGESFRGKPSRLELPETCGNCHADAERMNPYGLRIDQLARYKTSIHGKALFQKQDRNVAVCTDCHGAPHEVLHAGDPNSRTHPRNVPATCAKCHEDQALMAQYGLPTEVVDEYRRSVHGTLLLEQGDTGAPTCATCHGNHSAMPPGFSSVGAVCGQCHVHDAKYFAQSVHASEAEFRGCVQCHGGGEDRHDHLIERITQPPGLMIERYAHLLTTDRRPSLERVTATIHAAPKEIITAALSGCTACHEELAEDENLPKLFGLLDEIAKAESRYVATANRLDEVSRGVLLVENQRFEFEDAKTHLIALAPLQHTLSHDLVGEKVGELNAICDKVNAELDELERGLALRRTLLVPVWAFAVLFAVVMYVKFKQLKRVYVRPAGAPVDPAPAATSRRSFLDLLVGVGTAIVGVALAIPALAYLWPAAKGGAASSVEVEGAADMQPGQSKMVQAGGKPVVVVRGRSGFRAFSAVCTHLGCLVKWDAGDQEFKCPCHAAVFDENGAVVSGPPPAPLPELTVKEVGGQVYVTL